MPTSYYVLGSLACLCHLTAYGLYLWEMRRGETNPNTVSWAIWTALAMLNLASYGAMTKDWVLAATIASCVLGSIVTLGYVLKRGQRDPLNLAEYFAILCGAIAVLAWAVWRDATVANFIVLGGVIGGLVPTLRGVVAKRGGEHPAAWAVWTLGFAFTVGAALARTDTPMLKAVYPCIALFLHFLVFVIAFSYWRKHQPR